MKLYKIFNPKAYVRKAQFIDGRRRYRRYFRQIWPERADLENLKNDFKFRPVISIIVPTYNTTPKFFMAMIESVLGQVYENWQLVIVDDASPNPAVRKLIKKYAATDSRISHRFLKKNRHIAGATNAGFEIAKGQFVALLDHDDVLWPNALYEVVRALNRDRKLDLIYTDEDKMSPDGRRHRDPFLKPDWNPDLLLSINYITHFTVIRKKIIDQIGGEDGRYNGAQDWDLFLRATEATTAAKIFHIPKILYSWRAHDESTAKSFAVKPYVIDSQRRLLEAAFSRRGLKNGDYQLFENSGIWTRKIKKQNSKTGRLDFDKIKGLALNSRQIRRHIGRNSLIHHYYSHAQYNIDGELFTPNKALKSTKGEKCI
jgi:glycosyltransferase involved in cell wall biosynthesis